MQELDDVREFLLRALPEAPLPTRRVWVLKLETPTRTFALRKMHVPVMPHDAPPWRRQAHLLSDIAEHCRALCLCYSREEVDKMSVKELKALLASRNVDTRSFLERSEFVERAKALL